MWFSLFDQALRIRPLITYISHFPEDQKKKYLLDLIRRQLSEWRSLTRGAAVPYSLPGREKDDDWQYHPDSYPGSAVLFRPTAEPLGFQRDPSMGWSRFVKGRLDIEAIKGYHRTLIFNPRRRLLAEKLNLHLRVRGCRPTTAATRDTPLGRL
jgi:hypothetical protein